MTQRIKSDNSGEAGKPMMDELDVVRLTTDAYEKDGLKRGEQGTIVDVHPKDESGKQFYEVEFPRWEDNWPLKVKTVAADEIEVVYKLGEER